MSVKVAILGSTPPIWAVALRRVRTEHAKMVRRLTGTNLFQDKDFEPCHFAYMPTIPTSVHIDNLVLIEYD